MRFEFYVDQLRDVPMGQIDRVVVLPDVDWVRCTAKPSNPHFGKEKMTKPDYDRTEDMRIRTRELAKRAGVPEDVFRWRLTQATLFRDYVAKLPVKTDLDFQIERDAEIRVAVFKEMEAKRA